MQTKSGNCNTKAIRADDAEQIRPRLVEHRLLELRPKPRGDDNCARTFLAKRSHQLRDCPGRRSDHRKLRRLGQGGNIEEATPPTDCIMVWIDQADLAFEAAGEHVLFQGAADRPFLGARADDGNRARGECMAEITNCHWRSRAESAKPELSFHSPASGEIS